MPKRIAMTYNEANLEAIEQWKKSGGKWPAELDEVVAYVMDHKLWQAHKSTLRKQCKRDLARALREHYVQDPQKRNVRAFHAARVTEIDDEGKKIQKVLWAEINDAPRDHMEVALKQRRNQIVGDCRQLKTDADSYNQNILEKKGNSPIQLDFNLTHDLEELEQSDEYRPTLSEE